MADDTIMTKAELLAQMEKGWDDFNAYLKTLTLEQLTQRSDAAGWTAKDHVMHLAVWEDGTCALLQGRSRSEQMGVDAETWKSGKYDAINAIIQQRHRDKSWDEVMAAFNQVHQRLLGNLQSLSDEDLARSYRHYQPDSTSEKPVIGWISGNTYEHYAEHRPWIEAIAFENS